MIRPPRDDIDRLLNLLEAIAETVDQMTDEEVQAELAEARGPKPPCHAS